MKGLLSKSTVNTEEKRAKHHFCFLCFFSERQKFWHIRAVISCTQVSWQNSVVLKTPAAHKITRNTKIKPYWREVSRQTRKQREFQCRAVSCTVQSRADRDMRWRPAMSHSFYLREEQQQKKRKKTEGNLAKKRLWLAKQCRRRTQITSLFVNKEKKKIQKHSSLVCIGVTIPAWWKNKAVPFYQQIKWFPLDFFYSMFEV